MTFECDGPAFAPLHPGFNHNRHVILTSFFSQTIKISA